MSLNVNLSKSREEKFQHNFTSTPLQSMVCKSNAEMYVFENELSNELFPVSRHVSRTTLLSSSWSLAMPADMLERTFLQSLATCRIYVPDMLDSFACFNITEDILVTGTPFFVCLPSL